MAAVTSFPELPALDLAGRAELLGLSCKELLTLVRSDGRILAGPALETPGAAFRTRRWLGAGRPPGDLARIAFTGDDSVRSHVVAVIARLPAPVRHYAIEAVTWLEVGRTAAAWIHRAPHGRALPGDVGHVVVIGGQTSDERLPGVIAHELGHGWHRIVLPTTVAESTLSEREGLAALIRLDASTPPAAEQRAPDRARWIRAHVANELLADRQAAAWGIPHQGPDALQLRRVFAAAYDAAAADALGMNHAEPNAGETLAAAIEGAP